MKPIVLVASKKSKVKKLKLRRSSRVPIDLIKMLGSDMFDVVTIGGFRTELVLNESRLPYCESREFRDSVREMRERKYGKR